MSDPHETEVERKLAVYFAEKLDPQAGRAAERFAQRPNLLSCRRTAWRSRRWQAAAAVLTAACFALALWLSGSRRDHGEPQIGRSKPSVDERRTADGNPAEERKGSPRLAKENPIGFERLLLDKSVEWRTLDEGIVMLDAHTAVRKLRRQKLERVEWFDAARGARLEMLVPREEVVFVALPSY